MNLFNYYSLDECSNKKEVIKVLKSFKNDGKIEYSLDREILKIEDIDLDEYEVEDLLNLFDEYDVFPYLEMDDDDDSIDNYGDEYGDEEEY